MRTDTLSQQEIDKLLSRAGSGQDLRSVTPQSADLHPYDFRRPHRISKERLRTLEAMYEQLTKSLEGWLLGRVRGQVELRLVGVEQFSFGEFTMSLSTPCTSYLFGVNGSEESQGIVDFGREFSAFLVDRLFGGNSKVVAPERALTPIERMAVRVVADRVLSLLQEAWQDHIPLDLRLTGFESMPEILRGVSHDDSVLVATIEVDAADTQSLLLICLPFSVLEKFFSGPRERRLNSAAAPDAQAGREITEATLRETRVTVSARLPEFRLPLRDLASLRVGGVISTGIPADSELEVRINNQPRFRATAGRTGRRFAVRLNEDFADDVSADQLLSQPETNHE